MKTIDELATKINYELEKGNHLKNMIEILKEYKGDDWKKYSKFSDQGYTRNPVFKNDKFEILIICWNKGQYSGIHNHPENGCLVKVLKGKLIEKCYIIENDKLNLKSSKSISKNTISYQEGKLGLHNVINPSKEKCSVTIHIYSPPNYIPEFFNKN